MSSFALCVQNFPNHYILRLMYFSYFYHIFAPNLCKTHRNKRNSLRSAQVLTKCHSYRRWKSFKYTKISNRKIKWMPNMKSDYPLRWMLSRTTNQSILQRKTKPSKHTQASIHDGRKEANTVLLIEKTTSIIFTVSFCFLLV